MPRKSSVHFKPVSNVRFAVSHSERTDLSEPAYLLPKEHQLDNVIVTGSLSENELAALFIKQKEAMTGQAKARGSSPFWEGVVVLGNIDAHEQSANLLDWKKAYEQTTGHRVLHMSIHLDEGYVDATGHPQYNPHAHVIVSRMDSKNRVIKLERKELAAVQDLTAETLKMERGSTLAERGGKRGRAHIGHKEFRLIADEARLNLEGEKTKAKEEIDRVRNLGLQWSKEDSAKIKNLQAEASKVPDLVEQIRESQQAAAQQAQEIAQLQNQYRLDREAMKASGEAKQADYQQLKKAHEAALAALSKMTEKVATVTQENQDLKDDLAATQARFAAMASDYQEHKDQGADPALFVPGEPAPSKPIREAVTPATPPEATRTPVEAPKAKTPPTPQPAPEKSLQERFEASLRVFLEWIKGKGGIVGDVDTQQSDHYGPVVQLDDLHAVQSTGRGKYAVHELGKLDRVPALDDSKTEIRYRGGVGQVKGAGLGKGGRAD